MGVRDAQILAGSGVQFAYGVYSSLTGSSATAPLQWDGGRSSLLITGTQFGTLSLQVQNIDQSWVSVGSSIVANQLFPFDAPPGQYRLFNSGGSSIGLSAVLAKVPYNF